MRFLIALILLCSLNFPIANAIENKTNAVIKKSSAKTSFSSKKEIKSLNQSLYELADRIHQDINNHVVFIATLLDGHAPFKSVSMQPVKVFKRTVNHGYQFLFNCLFPKHTFW